MISIRVLKVLTVSSTYYLNKDPRTKGERLLFALFRFCSSRAMSLLEVGGGSGSVPYGF
jgi:hypothetical protein